MHPFKSDEVVILLGAGASVEAKIPHSADMINQLESKLSGTDKNWSAYKNLYYYVRSAIYYADGIRGRFDNHVSYNIERLVNTLSEISMRTEHTLYPFVGAWNPTLLQVAGNEFELVKEFRDKIVHLLRSEWLAPPNYQQDAHYFEGLVKFQRDYQYPLRVFTLNYDLCVEKICGGRSVSIERGFNDERNWDWRRFDDGLDELQDLYLYKLHGSTDWVFNEEKLTFRDEPSAIADADTAIIFGTTYKLQYRDPFLFFTYEFRKWTLEARIIVAIGYGFGDPHINKIIQQALTSDSSRILLAVSTSNTSPEEIGKLLEHHNSKQIIYCKETASHFMTEHLNLEHLSTFLPAEEEELIPVIERVEDTSAKPSTGN